jgi:hypothetical protein
MLSLYRNHPLPNAYYVLQPKEIQPKTKQLVVVMNIGDGLFVGCNIAPVLLRKVVIRGGGHGNGGWWVRIR